MRQRFQTATTCDRKTTIPRRKIKEFVIGACIGHAVTARIPSVYTSVSARVRTCMEPLHWSAEGKKTRNWFDVCVRRWLDESAKLRNCERHQGGQGVVRTYKYTFPIPFISPSRSYKNKRCYLTKKKNNNNREGPCEVYVTTRTVAPLDKNVE